MARHISQNFLNEFLNGSLKYILDYIHKDHTLDMELRGNEVTIYYRGGKLFSIREDGFELKYLDKKYIPNGLAINKRNIKDYIPEAKQCMDTWFATIKENWEKEIQQQIVRENNYSPTAEDTDYFIIDIEYEDNDKNMKDKKINEVNNETFSDTIFEKSSTDMRKWFYRIHLALND